MTVPKTTQFSLTRLAIHQIEELLIIEYAKKGRRPPSEAQLKTMAERFYKEHFG
ncbi:hypothetical protein IT396_02205 [Candidatus Nomurabacteria bacterium]|nr:hypothetical protein [Candidatus Nomurabacteria bacterium]